MIALVGPIVRGLAGILAILVAPTNAVRLGSESTNPRRHSSEVLAIQVAAKAKLFGGPVLLRRAASGREVFIFEADPDFVAGKPKGAKGSWRFTVSVSGSKHSKVIANSASLRVWTASNDSKACAAVSYAAKLLDREGSLTIPIVIGVDSTIPDSIGISFIRSPRGLGGAVLVLFKSDLSSYRIIHS